MAMHLFCYTSKSIDETARVVNRLIKQCPELFELKFLISQPGEINTVEKEIALGNGLDAQSIFLVRYNDKSALHMSSTVVSLIKEAFGTGDIVVLFENEALR